MRNRFIYWSVAALFAASAAFAQTGGRLGDISKFRADCGPDLQRLCPGVKPGGGRIIDCLLSHRSDLAAACRSDLVAARSAHGVAPNPTGQSPAQLSPAPAAGGNRVQAGRDIRASCEPDAQRLCAGALKESHGIVKCLVSHRMELSAICRSFFEQMHARRPEEKNARANNPPLAVPTNRGPAGTAAGGNIRASCGGDVQTLCAGASREDHGVVKCLVSHRTELSATCRSFFEQMRARRTEQ